MTGSSRALLALASMLLLAVLAVPLWRIRLVAPQYPEGIGMNIRASTVQGLKDNDLRNINSLNHYIGMKPIEAAKIPELAYMPWIIAAIGAAGFLVAAVGRRRLLYAWLVCFAALGALGMYDMWRWMYEFGHDLDTARAIIVVPGMSYQPPLIGTKQLLNFTASSWPAAGGWLLLASFALGAYAALLSVRQRKLAAST